MGTEPKEGGTLPRLTRSQEAEVAALGGTPYSHSKKLRENLMICEKYQGTGKRLNPRLRMIKTATGTRVLNADRELLLVPCGECIGGIASCCDAAGSADRR